MISGLKRINKSSIIVSLIFFAIYAGYGSFGQFNMYLKSLGFTGVQVGFIVGMIPLVVMLTVSLWGMAADRWGRKIILLIVLIMDAVFTLLFLIKGGFPYFLVLTFLYALLASPKGSLIDSVTMDYVKESGQTDYGKVRLFGALGYSAAAFITGKLISESNLSVIFPVTAGINLVAIVLIFSFMKFSKTVHVEEDIKFKNLKFLFEDKTVLVFFILIVFFGAFSSPLWGFYNFYLEEIGASNKIIGMSMGIMAISELPFYFLGSKILKKFGTKTVLMIAMTATALRMMCYFFISNPYHALMVDTTQGICYSIFVVAVVEYISDALPEKWRATGLAVMWTAYSGMGYYVGFLLSGLFYDNFKGKNMMMIMGLLTLCTAIATFVVFNIRDRREKKARIQVTI